MKKWLSVLALLGLAFSGLSNANIHSAAHSGDEQKVIELLAQKPDPDKRDSFGGTALHAAMFQDNINIPRLLIDAGFDVNAIGPRNGYTPLHDAVWADNLPAAKLLVERGANTKIKALNGNTPLDKARAENKTEMMAYLSSLTK